MLEAAWMDCEESKAIAELPALEQPDAIGQPKGPPKTHNTENSPQVGDPMDTIARDKTETDKKQVPQLQALAYNEWQNYHQQLLSVVRGNGLGKTNLTTILGIEKVSFACCLELDRT